MNTVISTFVRQCVAAIGFLLALTVVVGVAYPAVVWAASRFDTHAAEGFQVVDARGCAAGSSIIGINPQPVAGQPDSFLHARVLGSADGPMAPGAPSSSAASNQGPNSQTLTTEIEARNLITILVMLVIAIAVAALVDSATVRRVQAQRAAREAELLAVFSDAVLGGADVAGLLERVRETYDQRAVSVVHRRADGSVEVSAAVGEDPPQRDSEADTVLPARGDEYELLLCGASPEAQDRRVLAAVATQAAAALERADLEAGAAAARALAQTDELRRALLSAVSHDLRTPLSGAKAAVSSLRSEEVTFSPEDTAELLATIEESVDQLSALVANLLDSSRLDAGAIRPNMARTYLVEVLHRAANRSGPAAAGIAFRFGHVWAWTDGGLLERVLANLIDNAVRHGGGQVEVATSLDESDPQSPRTIIEVVDHGPGIPVERREQIFDDFRQGFDRNGSDGGVGLGLSVAQGFTSTMGGNLAVVDTPGGGKTMVVDLPAIEQSEQSAPAEGVAHG